MRAFPFILLFLVGAGAAVAQPFTVVETTVPPVVLSAAAFGDVDNDGVLELLLAGNASDGTRTATLFSIGVGVDEGSAPAFTNLRATLQGATSPSVAFGDYDNDGDLDFVLTGSLRSLLYRNDAGVFVETGVSLVGVQKAASLVEVVNTQSTAWGDYDNDGDLDLLLTGADAQQQPVAALYRNDGGAAFTRVEAGLPGITGSVAWGDFDGDGDLDLLAAHRALGGGGFTTIFRNDFAQGGTFTDLAAGFPAFEIGNAAWGDYDNDGDLDVLVAGLNAAAVDPAANFSAIYRNQGGAFSRLNDTLPFATYGAWLDYDGDGDLDVLLNATTPLGGDTQLRFLRNDGAPGGGFTDAAIELPGVWLGALAWGDLDRDGDLDVLTTGDVRGSTTFTGSRVLLYRNGASVNTPPTPPSGLFGRLEGDRLILEWQPAMDAETPPPGLTYNLRVGTAPGAADIVSPMALPDGTHLLPVPGNAGHNLRWAIRVPNPEASYFWSVQALDAGFKPSPFAAEQIAAPFQATDAEDTPTLPASPRLLDNYPNPFNPATTLRFVLPAAMPVRLAVFDALGREVAVLVEDLLPAGPHEARWAGRNATGDPLPSGLYVARLETPQHRLTRPMLMVK